MKIAVQIAMRLPVSQSLTPRASQAFHATHICISTTYSPLSCRTLLSIIVNMSPQPNSDMEITIHPTTLSDAFALSTIANGTHNTPQRNPFRATYPDADQPRYQRRITHHLLHPRGLRYVSRVYPVAIPQPSHFPTTVPLTRIPVVVRPLPLAHRRVA